MTSRTKAPVPTGPVFISYRQSDGSEIAHKLASLLRAAGIPVWLDRDDLMPGNIRTRIEEAIANGISGAVMVITPEIKYSQTIKELEAPSLLKLSEDHQEFTLCILNALADENTKESRDAVCTILELKPGTLDNVQQYWPDDRMTLVDRLVRSRVDRISSQRKIAGEVTDRVFRLSLQTRNSPQASGHTDGELDIRINGLPGNPVPELPSPEGLRDLKDTIGLLPTVVDSMGANRVRIEGGGHLSVAFAVGAALPSTLIGHMEVIDQKGVAWTSDEQARSSDTVQMEIEKSTNSTVNASEKPAVAVYIDFVPNPSRRAFDQYIEENRSMLSAWLHLKSNYDKGILPPSKAGMVAAEIVSHLRRISIDNQGAEIHLMLRTPFPLTLLIARLTNTLKFVVYDYDKNSTRYVKLFRVEHASPPGGAIREILHTG